MYVSVCARVSRLSPRGPQCDPESHRLASGLYKRMNGNFVCNLFSYELEILD